MGRPASNLLPAVLVALLSLACTEVDAAEAIVGQPFGVGRFELRLPMKDLGVLPGSRAFIITERNGRVFYPAIRQGALERLLGASAEAPGFVTVYFLFRGTEPLEVSVATPSVQRVRITPRAERPRVFDRELRRWWRLYRSDARQQQEASDYPPLVETYLSSMLARRLNLNRSLVDRIQDNFEANGGASSEGQKTLELLTGVERLRLETLQATSLGVGIETDEATIRIPEEIPWRRPALPPADNSVEVEPIALRVPSQCFYVRYGTFSNYLWLDNLLSDYGGDVRTMLSARGHTSSATERAQRRLGIKQSALAEILGPQVVSDVAFIGRDTYGAQGAAIGMLFQARSTTLLKIQLASQRNNALAAEQENGATEELLKIRGHDVSFMSTPDNAFRSFYVVDGDFHLVTTSRAIVESFLEVRDGQGALGGTDEFRYARSIMPLDREDTIFVYFSSMFFESLLSPQYQIELERRLKATTDIELIKMAQWAAYQEGRPNETIDDLIAGDLLPRGFGRRPDGSGPIVSDERIIDSLRGAPGSFLPVPDVNIRAVTPAEQARYLARANYYRQNWKQMDPLMIAVKRYEVNDTGRERLSIDAHIAPLDDGKYSWLLSSLGAPVTSEVVPPEGNIVLLQAAIRGGLLVPGIPPHTVFLGIQDNLPLTDPRPGGLLKTLQIMRTTPGFLGAWPKPGFLDMLPFGLAGQPDALGFSQLLLGLWRWQGRGFSILSFDRGILERTSQQIGFRDTDDPAQIKVVVGDLSQAQFANWLRALNYERARTTSMANVNFMHALTQQLGVPRQDAREVAEDLLRIRFVCSLGGEYQLREVNGQSFWYSTAWPDALQVDIPDDYESPILAWFRGMNAGLIRYADRLVLKADVDLQRKEVEQSGGNSLLEILNGSLEKDKPER